MRRLEDFSGWIRSLAEPVLRDTPLCHEASAEVAAVFLTTFADERGHRRAVDRPLLEFMLRRRGWMGIAGSAPPSPASHQPEVELWRSLAGSRASTWSPSASGPFIFRLDDPAIEVATEAELCAIHAARHLVHRADTAWATPERVAEAARWVMAHLQPDNATNHPWAVHVFAELGVVDPEAALYAQTLVSNSLALTGRPDRFSACLLLDAAECIRTCMTERQ